MPPTNPTTNSKHWTGNLPGLYLATSVVLAIILIAAWHQDLLTLLISTPLFIWFTSIHYRDHHKHRNTHTTQTQS